MTTTIELDVTVDYTYTPATAAYLSGPPENCYPEDPEEAEITSVMLGDIDIIEQLTSAQLDDLAAQCCEDARNNNADRDIP